MLDSSNSRRFRYSLRGLLILTTVQAILLGLVFVPPMNQFVVPFLVFEALLVSPFLIVFAIVFAAIGRGPMRFAWLLIMPPIQYAIWAFLPSLLWMPAR